MFHPTPYRPTHAISYPSLQESMIYAISFPSLSFFLFNGRGVRQIHCNFLVEWYSCLLVVSCSLLVAAAARLQRVAVTGCSEHCASVFLAAHEGVLDPRIGEDLVHGRALARIELQHAADNMSGLTW